MAITLKIELSTSGIFLVNSGGLDTDVTEWVGKKRVNVFHIKRRRCKQTRCNITLIVFFLIYMNIYQCSYEVSYELKILDFCWHFEQMDKLRLVRLKIHAHSWHMTCGHIWTPCLQYFKIFAVTIRSPSGCLDEMVIRMQ